MIVELQDMACCQRDAETAVFANGVIDCLRRKRKVSLHERLWEPFDLRRAHLGVAIERSC